MPFINIKVAGPALSSDQVARLQKRSTELIAGLLRKNAEVTNVLVEERPLRDWAIAGQPAKVAAHLSAEVTTGTNTPEEKASFIAEANQLLREVLGSDLSIATYVVVDEINADAWGYDGLTAESRRKAAARAA